MNIKELYSSAVKSLSAVYEPSEAQWLTRVIFERLRGYNRTYIVLHADDIASSMLEKQVNDVVARLLNHEPVQQIFGVARFYGMDFKVTPDTLIPRPETAELVDLIVNRNSNKSDLKVLDLGTGTGCIAIALALNLPFARVDAADISENALAVASANATALHAKVNFFNADILNLPTPAPVSYDIIVSNPPYIVPSEMKTMAPNVLDHEPHSALFVPENNPLLFYKAIATYARKALVSGGSLWFEMNPLFAQMLKRHLEQTGFTDIDIFADSGRKNRFIHAANP